MSSCERDRLDADVALGLRDFVRFPVFSGVVLAMIRRRLGGGIRIASCYEEVQPWNGVFVEVRWMRVLASIRGRKR